MCKRDELTLSGDRQPTARFSSLTPQRIFPLFDSPSFYPHAPFQQHLLSLSVVLAFIGIKFLLRLGSCPLHILLKNRASAIRVERAACLL
jgi:hypothetical protein